MCKFIKILPVLVLFLLPQVARAQKTADEKLFHNVMNRLLSSEVVKTNYPAKYIWPPIYFIKKNSEKELNAYATAAKVLGATIDEKSGKIRPVVMITQGYMKQVVKGDENILAVIMGHETAHIMKDHVGRGRKGNTSLLLLAFNR